MSTHHDPADKQENPPGVRKGSPVLSHRSPQEGSGKMSLCQATALVKMAPLESRAKPLYCRSWLCPTCRPKRKSQLLALAASGEPNRFLTLTVNPTIGDSPAARLKLLSHAWNVLVKRLRRQMGKAPIDYLAVVESTKAGEPHLHILLRSPYIPHAMISEAMEELIGAPIIDIRKIRSQVEVVRYVAKYITKRPTQFGTSKRYWHSRAYELPDDGPPFIPWEPTFRWFVAYRPTAQLYEQWFAPGWHCVMDDDGRVSSTWINDDYRQGAPPKHAFTASKVPR